MSIILKELNESNMKEYLSLSVLESQKTFIETPQGSLDDRNNRAYHMNWTIITINNNDKMVGYLMYGINQKNDVWLDRFMIDKRYQHKGYGKEALKTIIILLKSIFKNYNRIVLSVERTNSFAIKFYESFNFYLTGEVEDGELVMELKEKNN